MLTEWWHAFNSPELDDLINRGLANNHDVRIATFKIAQAKARAGQADAGKGPTINLPIAVTEQYPYYGPGGPLSPGLANVAGPHGETTKQLIQANLQASWRVDIWGELDSLSQSANFQLWRASFERDNAQANAAANIASSYVEYLSLNDRLQVARETETVLSGMVASVEERVRSGDATAIDLEQQRSSVNAVRATIPVLEQQREDAIGSIAFLMGTLPESLKLSDSGLDSISLPTVIPGVPSTLLLRRPDVRMVEARLLAADADIDVARARILPPLDLTAQAGYGSYYLAELFKPQALFWNAMANLSVSIFDGGKMSKEKAYAKAVHEEMVETYVRTIYQAVREVESSLNAIRQTERRVDAQKESADNSHLAWDYSSEAYSVGAIDFLTLLDTERTYHKNLDEYQRLRLDRYRSLISLFHALGGGVPQGESLPGKGVRPAVAPGSKDGVVHASSAPIKVAAVAEESRESSQSLEKEDAWLVELPGLYHRNSINAAWLDLKARFPLLMKNHFLHRHQEGVMEDSADKKQAWYQLFIAKFPTDVAAEEFCAELRGDYQRCRAVLSQKGRIINSVPASMRMDSSLSTPPAAEANAASAQRADSAKASSSDKIAGTPMQQTSGTSESTLKTGEASKEAPATGTPAADTASVPTPAAEARHAEAPRAEMVANTTGSASPKQGDKDAQPNDSADAKPAAIQRRESKEVPATVAPAADTASAQTPAVEARHAEAPRAEMVANTTDSASPKKGEKDAQPNNSAGAKPAPAAIQRTKLQNEGVEWSAQKFWLVEMTDACDRSTLALTWRDLLARFPAQMKDRTIIPRRYAQTVDTVSERTSLYQLYIAKFAEQNIAEEFCETLRAGKLHCDVISSHTFAMKDEPRTVATSSAATAAEKNKNGAQP